MPAPQRTIRDHTRGVLSKIPPGRSSTPKTPAIIAGTPPATVATMVTIAAKMVRITAKTIMTRNVLSWLEMKVTGRGRHECALIEHPNGRWSVVHRSNLRQRQPELGL